MPQPRNDDRVRDEFDQSLGTIVTSMIRGGVGLPWNLALAALIGLALLFTRIILDAEGTLANAHHVIGSLVLTVVSVAAAEVARPVRYINIALETALMAAPFMFGATTVQMIASMILGVTLVGLSIRRGPILQRYGNWSHVIV